MTGMREWRMQYPKATLRQIETELDTGLARMRARMLEELALQSTAATWQEQARLQAPTCPQYGTPLDERGTDPRTLLTHGGQELILERSYAVCSTCNSGLFPLDDESGLLPGQLTPRLQEGLVRLSTHIASFAKAAAEFAFWSQVTLARSTARRLTEAAGATAVAYQTAEADRILRECPPAPAGPSNWSSALTARWCRSSTPVVRGAYAGCGQPDRRPPRRRDYCQHDQRAVVLLAARYQRALRDAGNRRTASARPRARRTGGAVVDGAEWCQTFIELHAPHALRILDCPHAASS